jgi:hypothetical protein
MNFTDTPATDYGNSPEIIVDGLSSVERVTPNTVRLSFYSATVGGERRLVARLRMDTAVLAADLERLTASLPAMHEEAELINVTPIRTTRRTRSSR